MFEEIFDQFVHAINVHLLNSIKEDTHSCCLKRRDKPWGQALINQAKLISGWDKMVDFLEEQTFSILFKM